MIEAVWEPGKKGVEICRCSLGAKTFEAASRHGSSFALARKLTEHLSDDAAMIVRDRKGTVLFTLPSVLRAAKSTIGEGPAGETLLKFRPFPSDGIGLDDA